MSVSRKWCLSVVLWASLIGGSVWSSSACAFSSANVAKTVGALIGAKAAQMGFSPSDPRIAATRAAVTAYADSLAAAVGSGASWAAVGISAGLGALLGGVPQPLADGSRDQWTVNSDGTLTVSGNPHVAGGSVTSPFGSLANGATVFWTQCSSPSAGCVVSGSMAGAAQAYAQGSSNSSYSYTVDSCPSPEVNGGQCVLHLYMSSSGADQGTVKTTFNKFTQGGNQTYTGVTCGSGMAYWQGSSQGTCIAYAPYNPPVKTQSNVSLATAISALPASDQALPLAQPLMADTTDALWQGAAAQSGYQGLPYPANQPVTSTDVGTITQTAPSTYPQVGDLVAPAAAPAGSPAGTDPYAVTDPTATAQPAATNPGSGAEVNLGPDPGIGAPGLENTPTAAQILAPLLGLLPDLRSYVVPAHTGACPQPSFTWAGTTYTWSKHCDLVEQNRTLITGAFVVAFSLAALFIVLTA